MTPRATVLSAARTARMSSYISPPFRPVDSAACRKASKFNLTWSKALRAGKLRTSKAPKPVSLLRFRIRSQGLTRQFLAMHPNAGDGVVRIHSFERRLRHEHQIRDFSRLDAPDLRLHLELTRVADRSRAKNLLQRQPRLLQLLHFEKTIQPGQIPIRRRRRRVRAKQKIRVLAGQILDDLPHSPQRTLLVMQL